MGFWGFALGFEDGGHVGGGVGPRELAQHVAEDKEGFGGETGGGAHGGSAGTGTGVVGTKDEAKGVDEENAGGCHSGL